MKVTLGIGGCTLHREAGDKRISHESTVGYHMKLQLNKLMQVITSQGEGFIPAIETIMPEASEGDISGGAFPVESAAVERAVERVIKVNAKKDFEVYSWRQLHFVRMYPHKHGLTSCKLGLIDHNAKIALWHERYAIENAATEFNQGKVFFQRVEVE